MSFRLHLLKIFYIYEDDEHASNTEFHEHTNKTLIMLITALNLVC
jgi:hypothetical protein